MSEPIDPNNGEDFVAKEPNLDSTEVCSDDTKRDFTKAVLALLPDVDLNNLDEFESRVIPLGEGISVTIGVDEGSSVVGSSPLEYYVTSEEDMAAKGNVQTEYALKPDGRFVKTVTAVDASQLRASEERNAEIALLSPEEQAAKIEEMFRNLLQQPEPPKEQELSQAVGLDVAEAEATEIVNFLRKLKEALPN